MNVFQWLLSHLQPVEFQCLHAIDLNLLVGTSKAIIVIVITCSKECILVPQSWIQSLKGNAPTGNLSRMNRCVMGFWWKHLTTTIPLHNRYQYRSCSCFALESKTRACCNKFFCCLRALCCDICIRRYK